MKFKPGDWLESYGGDYKLKIVGTNEARHFYNIELFSPNINGKSGITTMSSIALEKDFTPIVSVQANVGNVSINNSTLVWKFKPGDRLYEKGTTKFVGTVLRTDPGTCNGYDVESPGFYKIQWHSKDACEAKHTTASPGLQLLNVFFGGGGVGGSGVSGSSGGNGINPIKFPASAFKDDETPAKTEDLRDDHVCEYVNAGFTSVTLVCKHCLKDK